ncbi:MAG: acetyl-CoA carboxylase carboxyltransferase subunit alpha [Verrucomicrobiota bacterium]
MNVAPLEFEKPILELERMLEEIENHSDDHQMDFKKEVARIQKKITQTRAEIYGKLSPWQRVQIVRHPNRPYTLDYIHAISDEFIELQGDRCYGDDKAIVGGLATFDGVRCMVIGHQKGRDTRENLLRNFGCAHPEGYRKALRLMKMADRFKLPIICFIDTPGAFPGIPSEERHIAEAIAVNLREMFTLGVPIIAVVIGEGGSGGALGIGIADEVMMLENAYYSVISPEGCASILWKDRKFAEQAASALKLSAPDLQELELVDEVINEPEGGAHHDHKKTIEAVRSSLIPRLKRLRRIKPAVLIDRRHKKYRQFGHFTDST